MARAADGGGGGVTDSRTQPKPKPDGRRRGRALPRLAGHKAEAVLLSTKNVENNPMQSNKGSLAWMLYTRKHFDTSGKSLALF
jgi:hypothetical protein